MFDKIEKYFIGEKGETMVEDILKRVPAKIRFVSNLYLKTDNKTTQIDFIVLTAKGIFVIEVKNVKGVVIANSDDIYWQTLINGKSYALYNPVLQNSSHIRVLRNVLGTHYRYKSLVVFPDDTELKGDVSGVNSFSSLWEYFEQDGEECLTDNDIKELEDKLNELAKENSYLSIQHNRQQSRYVK